MKVKGIKITIILSLLASILMPFSVYADSLQSHVVGINVWSDRLNDESMQQGIWHNFVNVHIEFELDNAYLGWTNLGVQVSYKNYLYGAQNPSWQTLTQSWSGNYYINGDSFEIIVPINFYSNSTAYYQNGTPLPNSDSYVTVSYTNQGNFTEIGSISDLSQVITLLTDINNNVSIDIYNELQSIAGYTADISKLRQFSFPVESLSFVYGLLYRSDIDYLDIRNLYTWTYPMFNIHSNKYLYETWINSGDSLYVIILVNRNIYNDTLWNQYFQLKNISDNSTVNVASVEPLSRPFGYYQYNLLKVRYDVSVSQNYRLFYIGQSDLEIIPIFCNRYSNMKNLTTDFALAYGFSNQLLDDLHSIANGNNNYDQSKDDLDDDTSDFITDSGNLIQIEENYLDDLDTSLQSIDTNTGLNIFGGNFLTSATWVRTQFDRLTYNNPFGSLIVYGMTLGLALLLLGKVML